MWNLCGNIFTDYNLLELLGLFRERHVNKSVCSEMTVAKIMISLFSLVNLSMIASGGIIFTLGLTGYWSADANFSYLMVIMH